MERLDNWGTVWPFPFFWPIMLAQVLRRGRLVFGFGMREDLKVSCSAEKQTSENNCENELHLRLGFNICFPEFWITLLLEITSIPEYSGQDPLEFVQMFIKSSSYDANEVTRKVRTVYTWIKSAGWTCKHLKVPYDAFASYSFRVSSWS